MPHSRPMPEIGRRCHELRIVNGEHTWRIIYRLDPDAIVIVEVLSKKTRKTPPHVIEDLSFVFSVFRAFVISFDEALSRTWHSPVDDPYCRKRSMSRATSCGCSS